jgi:hypothetical protein
MLFKIISLLLGLSLVSSFFSISITNAQQQANGFVKIRFIDNKDDHSKTFIGKLTKGKIENLKYELNNNFAEVPANINDRDKSESEGYIKKVTADRFKKKWKKNKQKASDDLLGNYEVKDEKSLNEVKEKKLKERGKRESVKNKSSNNLKNIDPEHAVRPNNFLSKNFKISGKRIHNGQTFKKHTGYVCLIVKYKIREGNYVNTYVSIVEDYLKEDSKYNLRYHGNGSKRKYFLEYAF